MEPKQVQIKWEIDINDVIYLPYYGAVCERPQNRISIIGKGIVVEPEHYPKFTRKDLNMESKIYDDFSQKGLQNIFISQQWEELFQSHTKDLSDYFLMPECKDKKDMANQIIKTLNEEASIKNIGELQKFQINVYREKHIVENIVKKHDRAYKFKTIEVQEYTLADEGISEQEMDCLVLTEQEYAYSWDKVKENN